MGQPSSKHSDYEIEKELSRVGNCSIYRALRRGDRSPMLLKLFRTPADADEAAKEFQLSRGISSEHILSPVDLVTINGVAALVFDDSGGYFLNAQLTDEPMPVAEFFELALAITKSLQQLHASGIVHRAIQPASLYVDPYTPAIRIAALNHATGLPRTSQRIAPQQIIDGTLAYLAPEQTGRMNRQVDRRTDLYSVGVLFYRMLTGTLPFTADQPLELTHELITRKPDPPRARAAVIPEPLSRIVLKLLEKNAEDRYHSAVGLTADLERCLDALQTGEDEPYELGTHDPIESLQIPARLYGREAAIGELLSAFDRVRAGTVELLTVAGYSGTGKTSLVLEVQKTILDAHGFFTVGKFDQLTRDKPYSALIQALNDLVRQLLTEPDDAIAQWRDAITGALGNSAHVVLDVVPDLELIIGSQPPAPRLAPTENRNRMELQLQRLLSAVARRDHPLVLFLDDLQWADTASLQLMTSLLLYSTAESFLLVGAYRDNELDSHHPLSLSLKNMEAAGARLSHCRLGPLQIEHVEMLLADTLGRSVESVRSLAALVQEKTQGNPFFARTFLETAFNKGLIKHDDTGDWHWDTTELRCAQPTENVVELLATRIDQLPEDSRRAMEMAACVGNRFDVPTLATVLETGDQVIHQSLLPPLHEGLIEVRRSGDYAFAHDRIQEAAHSRISEHERVAVHYRIGTLLQQQAGDDSSGDRLFVIADHLNQALAMLDNGAERRLFGGLNLRAGDRARKSAAFDAAYRYYDHGILALGGHAWKIDETLAFALYLGRAEAAFLVGRTDEAEADTATLLHQVCSELQRSEVYLLAMVQYENSGRFIDAVNAGRSALKTLGIDVPEDPVATSQAKDEALEAVQWHLQDRKADDLLDLPEMGDPVIRMSMRLLMTLWPSAYISGNKELTVLIATRMVLLSLQHGNAPESAYGYVTHAITLGAVLHDHAGAYRFGQLALGVNQRFDDLRSRAKVNHMFSCYIGFWCRPINESFVYSREAYSAGLESGDFVYAAYGCFHESWHALFSGMNLRQYHEEYADKLAFLERTGNRSFCDAHQLMLHWGMSLQGRTGVPGGLSSAKFNEQEYLAKYRRADFFVAFHRIARLSLLYTFGDLLGARSLIQQAESVSLGVRGMIWDAWLCFYSALALAAQDTGLPEPDEGQQRRLDQLIEQMSRWADSCPQNFSHQRDLLQAERARLRGQLSDAIEGYEAAIAGATEARFIHHQALTKERYAEFWLSRKQEKLASFYLNEALFDYERWGAAAKVAQLAERHATLLAETARSRMAEVAATDSNPLDSAAIINATRALSGEIDDSRLVSVLLTLLIQAAGAERAILFENADNRLTPRMQAQFGSGGTTFGPLIAADWRDQAAEKALNYVKNTRRSLLVGNAAEDDRLAADPYVARRQVRSIICAPILRQSKLDGIVYLENGRVIDAFTADRLALVEVLAAQAAISLGNARLILGLQREAEQREKAERRMREVAQGTAAVVGDSFFQELVLHLSRAMDVRIAFVTECLSKEQKRVRALAFVNNGQVIDGVEYELDGTPCKGVIEGNICFYSDLLETLFPSEKGLASYLGVPMYGADNTIVGHLAVVDDRPMLKSTDDVELLQIFAIRASAELERQRAQLETERTQRKLAERERLASIGEFASMITHEIRSPLSTIAMALDYLQSDHLAESAAKRLRLATTESDRLQSLLSEILLFAKPHELHYEHLDLDQLIGDTIDRLTQLPVGERRRIEYRCTAEDHTAVGDRDKLTQVFINLTSNACQAIREDQQVTVELTEGPQQSGLLIIVSNPGSIPETDLAKLTEPFFTTKSRGTGLGLAIVKRIVDAHRGHLRIQSDPTTGVTVTVTLPTGND